MLIPWTTHLVWSGVFKSVYEQRSRGPSPGFLQLKSSIIGDVITLVFTVSYDVYNSQHPELVYSEDVHPPCMSSRKIALLV